MPRFDFQCNKCHVVKEYLRKNTRRFRHQCGGLLEWVPSARVNASFKPFVHEHLGHEPVMVESWGHYKKLLRARGLNNELAS